MIKSNLEALIRAQRFMPGLARPSESHSADLYTSFGFIGWHSTHAEALKSSAIHEGTVLKTVFRSGPLLATARKARQAIKWSG